MSLARSATASQSSNYERHQSEQTLLYQLVEQYYPAFKASLEAQGQQLPRYIQQEFDDFLQCGRLEYGFYACVVRIAITSVLRVVYLINNLKAYTASFTAAGGATYIQ